MVHLFPENISVLDDKNIVNSEKIIYKLFKNLSGDWYIWHSVEWMEKPDDRPLLFGESDFLIFNPNKGFLILEIKGGAIKRRLKKPIQSQSKKSYSKYLLDDYGAIWSRDYYKKGKFIKNEPLKNNPFMQARKSMFYFLRFYDKYINSYKDQIEEDLFNKLLPNNQFPGNFNCGVVFPGCEFKKSNKSPMIFFVEEMIFDLSNINEQKEWDSKSQSSRSAESPMEKYLNNLFKMHHKREPPKELKQFFIQIVNYEINTNFSLNSWLEDQEYVLEKINRIQDFLLDALELKRRCLISGSAGTGKTYIAMKKFLIEKKKGKKTLFLCYNKKLNEFINYYIKSNHSKELSESKSDYQIITINFLLYSIARKNLQSDKFEFFIEKMEQQNVEQVRKIIFSILGDDSNDDYKFDSIIVDEGQDINNNLWPLINKFLKDDKDSVYYVFYDQSQLKFNKEFEPSVTGLNLISDQIKLTKNLRNADQIAKWIEKVTNFPEYNQYLGLSSIKSDFEPINAKTLLEALRMAIKEVARLHQRSMINPRKFTVLCDKKLMFLPKEKYKLKEMNLDRLNWVEKKFGINIAKPPRKVTYYFVETKTNKDLAYIRQKFIERIYIAFNGIGTYKGLENDIIMLIVKKPELGTGVKYENYLRDIYIGASRAKFLLYIFTYLKE